MVTKRAVLVGCLYRNTHHELHGSETDVREMKRLLISRFDFQEENIQVLTDKSHTIPTKRNIMAALNRMIVQAEPEDVLFFFFSGHGISLGHQQAIIPLDAIGGPMNGTDLITSHDFRTLVNKVPSGATLTIVADSGHSGRLMNGVPAQIETPSCECNPDNAFGTEMKSKSISSAPSTIPSEIPSGTESDRGILLSASRPDKTAFEVVPNHDHADAYGAFTHAIREVLGEHRGPLSNKELATYASQKLKGQHLCLYCSDGNADAIFLLQS